MELDFKYRQFGIEASVVSPKNETEGDNNLVINKPYQEVIDYFEQNKAVFNYKEFINIIKNITQEQEFSLEDGTKVKVVPMEKLVHLAIKYSDGNKFIGTFTNITDENEFDKAMEQ